MIEFVRKFSSLKITLLGMGLLAAGAALSYGNPTNTPIWVLIIPMLLLAINLTAAIATNERINQQPGLLLFHVSLLLIVVLAAMGRLTHLDAHLELVAGTEFSPDGLLEVSAGPLHSGDLDKVRFVQGQYTVQYSAGLKRGLTHSYVTVESQPGHWEERVVGDDRPLVIKGYRFYTTFNKGFTPVLTWIPSNGEPVTGTVNMPSYPLFEYKQDNRWTPPGTTEEIKFWLQLNTGMNEDADWVLDGKKSSGVLIVTTENKRREVPVGGSVVLPAGTLRFDALTTWMGYRLFYDPTIQWMFFVAIMGVLGLTQYFWKKINLQPWMDESPDARVPDTVKPSEGEGGQIPKANIANKDQLAAPLATGEKH